MYMILDFSSIQWKVQVAQGKKGKTIFSKAVFSSVLKAIFVQDLVYISKSIYRSKKEPRVNNLNRIDVFPSISFFFFFLY